MRAFVPIPTQPGPWGMALTSIAVGAGVGVVNGWVLLFTLSSVSLFVMREPVDALVRRRGGRPMIGWTVAYGLASLAFSLPLLLGGRWLLVPLGFLAALALVTYALLVRRKKERTWWGELMGIGGLSLGAWGAYYASTGDGGGRGFLLWLLLFLYLGASVFYVKMMVRRKGPLPLGRRWGLSRDLLLYLALLAAFLTALVLGRQVAPFTLLAFLPLFLKVAWSVLQGGRLSSIQSLGKQEVAHTTLFALLLVLAFRLTP